MNNTEDHENSKESSVDEEIGSSSDNTEESADAALSEEEKIKDLEDQLLRAKAEVQNVRRIAAQEVTKARLFGVESLAKEFLSVADNLERAIESCKDDNIKEGLDLTLKSLENSLKIQGIEQINEDDKTFDPEKHEAISVLEDETLETNTIIDFVQKGYTILDRTLRPSKVVVSKKPQEN